MNRTILLLIIVFGLSENLSAQTDFRQGFVIKTSNDTLYGMINFKEESKNPKECVFKISENEGPVTFSADDINGYRYLNDKYFVSRTIPLKGLNTRVFLEYLVNGVVDLYSFKTEGKTYFFIQKEGSEMFEVSDNEEFVYSNGNISGVKTDKKYTGKLKILFADAPELYSEIDKVTVDRKSLIEISRDYHEQVCKENNCIIYEKKIKPTRINIGPDIGMSSIYIIPEDLTFRNIYQEDIMFHCDFEASNSLGYGLFCNISLPLKNDNYRLQYEGLVSSHYFTSYYTKGGEQAFSLSSTDLSHYLFLNVAFSDKAFKPVLQVGCFANQKLKLEKSGIEPDDYLADIFPKESYFGFSLGIGCAIKINQKKDILLKATYSQGYGSYIYLNTRELNFTISMPMVHFIWD